MTKELSKEIKEQLKIASMEVGNEIIKKAYAELIKEHDLVPSKREEQIFKAGIVTGAYSALAALMEYE